MFDLFVQGLYQNNCLEDRVRPVALTADPAEDPGQASKLFVKLLT